MFAQTIHPRLIHSQLNIYICFNENVHLEYMFSTEDVYHVFIHLFLDDISHRQNIKFSETSKICRRLFTY